MNTNSIRHQYVHSPRLSTFCTAIVLLLLVAAVTPGAAKNPCDAGVGIETYLARGETAATSLDYEGALAEYTCAVAVSVHNAADSDMTSLIRRALIYRDLGYFDAYLADLQRVLN